ncbi:hypothetical protein V8E54_001283 [Elaphomyces granulatus]
MPVHTEKEAKHWWMNRFENLVNTDTRSQFLHFLMMPHGHFSKVEKTQDFVLHGDRLRQMAGYFASFPEWPKRFELVTGEDGCRLKTATENSPTPDQVNPPTHAHDSKVPTTEIGIVESLRPGILSPIRNWKLSAVAKPVFPAPFFSSSD